MIRPLTIATFLMACGSGLYLYQSKHEVQLLDRTIERTVHDTGTLREQSRLLAAEWTMLNDPDRLRQFSDTYLSLKSIAPAQFISLADLDSRLPSPLADPAPPGADDPDTAPVEAAVPAAPQAPAAIEPPTAAVADEALPVPPIPAVAVAVARAHPAEVRIADRPSIGRPLVADTQPHPLAVADGRPFDQRWPDQRPPEQRPFDQRPPEQRPFDQRPPEQRVFDQRPPEQRPFDQRPLEQRAFDQRPPDQRWPDQRPPDQRPFDPRIDVRPAAVPAAAPPRPILAGAPRPPLPASIASNGPPAIPPYRPAMVATSTPYSGSLLGMARGSMPPAPRPTAVIATYNSN